MFIPVFALAACLRTSTNGLGFSDAQFDSWPQGVVHNYVADAKRIILATVNETWGTLFAVPDGFDEFVLSEVLLPTFFE